MKRLIGGCTYLASLSIMGSAYAAAPVAFGQWTSQGGQISATCPTGIVCETIASSSGFLQQAILDSAGDISHIYTIITDQGVSGNADTLGFSTENVVRRNDVLASTPDMGLASRQVVQGDSTVPFDGSIEHFELINTTQTGWAAEDSVPSLTNEVLVTRNNSTLNTEFETSFLFEANIDDTGRQSGFSLNIGQEFVQPMGTDQRMGGDDDDDSRSSRGAEEAVGFALRITGGDMTQAGSANLPSNGGITWNDGDVIAGMWTGQSMNHWQELEDEDEEGVVGFEALKMAIMQYENRTQGREQAARWFSYSQANPSNWATNAFGATPAMPAYIEGNTGPRSSRFRTGSPSAQAPYQLKAVTLDDSAPAGAPSVFSSWSVANGVISVDCPVGSVCDGGIGGNGFLQQIVRNPATNEHYIRMILTDYDATGTRGEVDFSSESLVPMTGGTETNAVTGILSLQLLKGGGISESQEGWSDRTVVRTGWADEPGLNSVEITQLLGSQIPEQGFDFSGKFDYKANIDQGTGSLTGFEMASEQAVQNSYKLNPVARSNTDNWMFVRREIAGDFLTTSGSGSSRSGDNDDGGGGSISWSPGDDIKVTWLGQRFSASGGDDVSTNFYYQSYDRVGDGVAGTYSADREDGPGPRGWISVFGAQPVYPFGGSRNRD